MKPRAFRWGVVSAAGLLLVLAAAMPPIPPAKARAARIQSVNHLAQPFPVAFTLTNAAATDAAASPATP